MHQPTDRVLKIIELVTSSETPLRLSDISLRLSIPKSTLLPILNTLTDARFLIKTEAGYSYGSALCAIGARVKGGFPILDMIHSRLEAIVGEFGETCYFGTLDNGDVRYIDKADSPNPLRMLTSVGHRLPAYATGVGKALLLDMTEDELYGLYGNELVPLTKQTLRQTSELAEQLRLFRESGYSSEEEESTDFIRCFGVPVRKSGRIAGAVSIAIPVFRYREEDREAMVASLTRAAEDIGKAMEESGAEL